MIVVALAHLKSSRLTKYNKIRPTTKLLSLNLF